MRVVLACGLAMLVAAGLAMGGDAKSDLAKLQGSWTAEKDGKKGELKFDKDNFIFTIEDKPYKGTFKIDASKKPKEMDLTITEGPKGEYEGKTSRAIYALEGESLKWCANEPGREKRPAEFAEKGNDYLYLVFKRAK